jgi:hypothetical protein
MNDLWKLEWWVCHVAEQAHFPGRRVRCLVKLHLAKQKILYCGYSRASKVEHISKHCPTSSPTVKLRHFDLPLSPSKNSRYDWLREA